MERTRQVKRTQGILQAIGVTVHPEVLTTASREYGADVEGFNIHRRQHKTIRNGLDGKVRRSPKGHGMQEEMYQGTREAPLVPHTTYRY